MKHLYIFAYFNIPPHWTGNIFILMKLSSLAALEVVKWQLPVQPVMKILSKWQHFRLSALTFRRCSLLKSFLTKNQNRQDLQCTANTTGDDVLMTTVVVLKYHSLSTKGRLRIKLVTNISKISNHYKHWHSRNWYVKPDANTPFKSMDLSQPC